MNSAEIAAAISSQNAMFGNQAAFANQISGGYGGNFQNPYSGMGMGQLSMMSAQRPGGMAGEEMAYRGMQVGAGLMNGVSRGMGMAGSVLGAFGPPGMIAGAALNVGGQLMNATVGNMMQGAQQQMQLNNMLRSNFNFMGSGQQGFGRGDMAQIGQMIGQQTHQTGAGGQMADFSELSRLAGSMSRSGGMTGVRDVQEFSRKFKETLTTLKTMAKDLNTTLEGAMEFAQAQKASGVFGGVSQTRFSGMTRQYGLAGGLATTELTSMANIGSQIARSMGGLGQQGAFGGMRAIGNLGTSMQIGGVSEQDVYNATGATGAEGRQAMATRMLQVDAQFFRSSKGRRMLASMAGKDGSLDQDMVDKVMSGNMSIAETGAQIGSHLGGVGRANFIRNEGRLRSAAMEKFGGMGAALQLREWTQGRGIDLFDKDDDRGSIWAQRTMGVSRDEADVIMKQARDLPRILKEQARVQKEDTRSMAAADRRSEMGLQGLSKKFEQAKHAATETIQQAGRNMLTDASDWIDDLINGIFHTYKDKIDSKAQAAVENFGGDAAQRMKAIGGEGWMRQMEASKGASTVSFADASVKRYGSLSGMLKGAAAGAPGGVGGIVTGAIGGIFESDIDRYRSAGWDMDSVKDDKSLKAKMDQIQKMQDMAGTKDLNREFSDYGASNKDQIRDMYLRSEGTHIEGNAEKRMKEIADKLPPELKKKYEAASMEEKVRMIASMEGGAGVAAEKRIGANLKGPGLAGLSQKPLSALEQRKMAGETFTSKGAGDTVADWLKGGGIASGPAGWIAAGIGYGVEYLFGTDKKAMEQYATTDEAKDTMDKLLNGDATTQSAARDHVRKQMEKSDGDIKKSQGRMVAASEYNSAKSAEEKNRILKDSGMSEEEMQKTIQTMSVLVNDKAQQQSREARKQIREGGQRDYDTLKSGGAITIDKDGKPQVSADVKGALAKVPGGEALLLKAVELTDIQRNVGDDMQMFIAFQKEKEFMNSDAYKKLSTSQQLEFAKQLSGTGMGDKIKDSAQQRGRLEKAGKGASGQAALLQELNLDVSKKQMGKMDLSTASEGEIRELLKSQGAGDLSAEGIKTIKTAALSQKAGDIQGAQEKIKGLSSKDNEILTESAKKRNEAAVAKADPGAKLVADAVKTSGGLIVSAVQAVGVAIASKSDKSR